MTEVLKLSEEDKQEAVENILADFSLEHLRYTHKTGDEGLAEKVSRITLNSLAPDLLENIEDTEVKEHICSRKCGEKVELPEDLERKDFEETLKRVRKIKEANKLKTLKTIIDTKLSNHKE